MLKCFQLKKPHKFKSLPMINSNVQYTHKDNKKNLKYYTTATQLQNIHNNINSYYLFSTALDTIIDH